MVVLHRERECSDGSAAQRKEGSVLMVVLHRERECSDGSAAQRKEGSVLW